MNKALYYSVSLAVTAMLAACGNTSKNNSSGTGEKCDSTMTIVEEVEMPPITQDTIPVSSDDIRAIMTLIYKAYYDPTLTAETERVYSSAMLDRFRELGISGDVRRPDLMSDDLKNVWNSFHLLDTDLMIEFLDWDLFFCGQDIYELQVTVDNIDFKSDKSAEATLKVINSGQLTPVSLKLIKDNSGLWKFDDITWENAAEYIKEPMRAYVKAHK